MTIIFLLVIVSLLVAVGFLALFIWAVRSGQFEDTFTPSLRILFEDKSKPEAPAAKTKKIKTPEA